MDELQRLLIERACQRLVLQFAKYNDDLDHQALADLFVEDCVFVRPLDTAHPYYGRDRVHAIFRDRKARLTRHVMTNILIDVVSPTEARGYSYVTMISSADTAAPQPGEGIFFGAFDDEFVRTDAGWKFKARRGSLALHQGGAIPVLPVPSREETGAPA